MTAFQPTLAALPSDATSAGAVAVRHAIAERPSDGAKILGLHMEGPYVSPQRPGAMDPAFFRGPSREEIEDLEAVAPGVLRHLTLAPEREGALELTSWLARSPLPLRVHSLLRLYYYIVVVTATPRGRFRPRAHRRDPTT